MKYIYELMLENYARQICLFQSPRSGKIVSDLLNNIAGAGNFSTKEFQSPRSGKLVSDNSNQEEKWEKSVRCFNPLDRGNLYLIQLKPNNKGGVGLSFNPLDRGNLYLIKPDFDDEIANAIQFQSPRSGKFVSNHMVSPLGSFTDGIMRFNPLDRGNLYLISTHLDNSVHSVGSSFNPLDRGNLYLIKSSS